METTMPQPDRAPNADAIPQAPSTIGAAYTEPSADEVLAPKLKIDRLFPRALTQPSILQRIGERTYWVHVRHYNTVFHVGEEGVLLLDALEGCHAEVTAAIAAVTDKPVTAIVYPHFHADHVADMPLYVEDARRRGVPLRIAASAKTIDKMAAVGSALPPATETVAWPDGELVFEDTSVLLYGFEWAAHCEDHSVWLLQNEGVAHAPDLIFPDQPPFWKFGGNDRFLFYERNLQEVSDLEWKYLSGGHGNVGYQEDIDFQLRFIGDLRKVVGEAFSDIPFDRFIDVSQGNHASWLDAFMKEVGEHARARLRDDYGSYYGFESTTPQNAEMVAFTMFAYR